MVVVHKAQGKTFEQNLNHIGHGKWVVELIKVDDQPVANCYSDPYPNERAARAGAKHFAEKATYHQRYGWCIG